MYLFVNQLKNCGESHVMLRRMPYDRVANAIRCCGERHTMLCRMPYDAVPNANKKIEADDV